MQITNQVVFPISSQEQRLMTRTYTDSKDVLNSCAFYKNVNKQKITENYVHACLTKILNLFTVL